MLIFMNDVHEFSEYEDHMFTTLKTLLDGSAARTDERLKDVYAVELIDQKIREAETTLAAAKRTLASLIQRQRSETRLMETLETRKTTITQRAAAALQAGREDLATDAAQAIADMENEQSLRQETLDRLDRRVMQLRSSVEAGHRRIVDLRQGAITACAIKREQSIQTKMRKTLRGTSAADEAEALIARVVDADDPFEQATILSDIDRGLTQSDMANRLADAGFGTASKTSASDVLRRLRTQS